MEQSKKQGFFLADTEEQAHKMMQELSGCRVWKSVFPTLSKTAYYISENSEMYACVYVDLSNTFKFRKIKPAKCNKYLMYHIALGVNERLTKVCADKLLYCTFILRKWDDDLKIGYKDGNHFNISLDNLYEKKSPITLKVSERMCEWSQSYTKHFNHVAKIIRFEYFLDIEDAMDITQDTFIDLMVRYDWVNKWTFESIWLKHARETCIRFYERKKKQISLLAEEFNNSSDSFSIDKAYEVDMLCPIKRDWRIVVEKRMQGMSNEEIANELGVTVKSIGSKYFRAITKLRQYWGQDKELVNMMK